MRILLIIIGLFLINAEISEAYSVKPINLSNPDNINQFVSSNQPTSNDINLVNINKIERQLFGKTYTRQALSARLSRLERKIFTTTYSNLPDSQRLDNIISNYNKINMNPNISTRSLSNIEKRIFNQDYPDFTAQTRIERLEQQLFGAIQSGNLKARAKALEIVSKNYNDTLQQSNQNLGNGILGSIGNVFSRGVITGMSPSINNINPFYTQSYQGYNYNNPHLRRNNFRNPGYYRGYRTPWGYGNNMRTYGSRTGVRILD